MRYTFKLMHMHQKSFRNKYAAPPVITFIPRFHLDPYEQLMGHNLKSEGRPAIDIDGMRHSATRILLLDTDARETLGEGDWYVITSTEYWNCWGSRMIHHYVCTRGQDMSVNRRTVGLV
jgi:hypothetical protein